MRIIVGKAVLVALGFLLALPAARAAEEPEAKGVVAVRERAMESLGGHSGAIQKILTEKPDLVGMVPLHAQAIAGVVKTIPQLFPDGSSEAPSKALPKVWEDKAGFQQSTDRTEQLALQLAEVSKGGDVRATLAAFTAMGRQGCGGCHQDFRVRQNQ